MWDRLGWAAVVVISIAVMVWCEHKDRTQKFQGFDRWRAWTDMMWLRIGAAGVVLLLAAGITWKFHLHHALSATLFFLGMACIAITQVILLRYIGMPNDADVEKDIPGWTEMVKKAL